MGNKLGRKRKTLPDRFWPFVYKTEGCWRWGGREYPDGRLGRVLSDPDPIGRRRALSPQRCAWELENGPVPDGKFVLSCPKNGRCVRASHLRLGGFQELHQSITERGLRKKNTGPKLTVGQVGAIKARIQSGEKLRLIAKDFGVSVKSIYRISTGQRWPEVKAGQIGDMTSAELNSRGERHYNSILTEQAVKEIRMLAKKGVSNGEISAIYGIEPRSVWDIVTMRTWRHVKE